MTISEKDFNLKQVWIVIGILISIGSTIGYLGDRDWNSPELIYTYNPFVDEMEVYLDEKNIIYIKSQEKKIIRIKKGKHHIVSKVGNYTLVDAEIKVSKENREKGALLNLTNSPMFLWGFAYIEEGYNEDNIDWSVLDVNRVIIDGERIIGDIKEYPAQQIIIQKEWDVDIDQAIATRLNANSSFTNGIKIKHKIFTKSSMLNHWIEYEKPLYNTEIEQTPL